MAIWARMMIEQPAEHRGNHRDHRHSAIQGPTNASWLDAAPSSGTLAPSASKTVALTASRSGLADGQHQTNVQVASNGGQGCYYTI